MLGLRLVCLVAFEFCSSFSFVHMTEQCYIPMTASGGSISNLETARHRQLFTMIRHTEICATLLSPFAVYVSVGVQGRGLELGCEKVHRCRGLEALSSVKHTRLLGMPRRFSIKRLSLL